MLICFRKEEKSINYPRDVTHREHIICLKQTALFLKVVTNPPFAVEVAVIAVGESIDAKVIQQKTSLNAAYATAFLALCLVHTCAIRTQINY